MQAKNLREAALRRALSPHRGIASLGVTFNSGGAARSVVRSKSFFSLRRAGANGRRRNVQLPFVIGFPAAIHRHPACGNL
jgi:hypothetical protein